ncbi:MAG TPA: tRNA (adenosine(37)-N6)-threonylcarbamoyltransferase complex dimerization subunit type 1 TsaB [Anaerolineae bacterium]|nr:tRNA (adenosine(37)-N6)-threonylcarbamoyltransferase complex dimerization subunit type 1 TsaB [Anaerolineae bacterium]
MLLAIDTSTKMIGIALYREERVIGEMTWVSQNHHTVELGPAIDELISKSGFSTNELAAIGIAIGPGSFTGLRIGLAFAKGLALSLPISLIGIPSLDIIASLQPIGGYKLAAILESGRKRFAVGWYKVVLDHWEQVGNYENLTILELRQKIHSPTLICGELTKESRRILARRYKNVIIPSPANCVRRPAILAELAWRKFVAGQIDDPATLAPIYLHYGVPIPE